MKTTVRCTQLFCKCGTPIRACRHSVVETAYAIPHHGIDAQRSVDFPGVGIIEQAPVDHSLNTWAKPIGEAIPQGFLADTGRTGAPDFAADLAAAAQAMINAVEALSEEAFASLPETVWNEIQTSADILSLALFNFHTANRGQTQGD